MKNIAIVESWKNGREAQSANFSTDGQRIYSYGTLLGITANDGKKIGLNVRGEYKLSRTTSAHVGLIAKVADEMVNPVKDDNGKPSFTVKEFNRVYPPAIYRQFSGQRELAQFSSAMGYHWFDKDSMRFFNSLIHDVYHHATDTTRWNVFISSERNDWGDYPRLFTVRHLMADGSIEDIGEFQQYSTLAQARKAAKAYIK